MFILKKGHQPGVYVPLRALFLVFFIFTFFVFMDIFTVCRTEQSNINAQCVYTDNFVALYFHEFFFLAKMNHS